MTSESDNSWKPLVGLIGELKECDKHNITMASVIVSFVCIDALANLSRPEGKDKVTRTDFMDWVDDHLIGHAAQPYQYRGKDVYAARCAVLHTYGSEAELHAKDPDTIMFAYHDGGRHEYKPDVEPGLVLIGAKSFVNDVIGAADSFLKECQRDESLRKRVEPRLGGVLCNMPLPLSAQNT